LPFLPLFSSVLGVASSRMLDSRGFAAQGNLTFRVMGGKGGTIAARNGKRWQGGWQKRQGLMEVRRRSRAEARGCRRVRVRWLARYAVVKELVGPVGPVTVERNYHILGGMSRNLTPYPATLGRAGALGRAVVAVGQGIAAVNGRRTGLRYRVEGYLAVAPWSAGVEG